MSLAKGEIIKKSDIIDHFSTKVNAFVDNKLTIQQKNCDQLYPEMESIKDIFQDVNYAVPTKINITNRITNSEDLVKADDIVALFENYMTKYSRGRKITFRKYFRSGSDGSTYSEISSIPTYGYMSDILAENSPLTGNTWNNSSIPPSCVTTQPPYLSAEIQSSSLSTLNDIVPTELININNYNKYFNDLSSNLSAIWDTNAINLSLTTCHSNCHSSCHGSRSRR